MWRVPRPVEPATPRAARAARDLTATPRTRAPREPHPAHPRALFTCLCNDPALTRAAGPRGTLDGARGGHFFDIERKTAQHQRGDTRRATSARTHAEPEGAGAPAEGAERAHTHTVPTHRQLFSIKAVYVPLPLALPNIRQATEPAPRLELEGEPEHLVVPRIEQRPHPKHAVVLCRDVLERQKVCLCAILPSQASD